MYYKFNKFHFRMTQHTTVVATARAHCVTRQFMALIGMSDQSFRIYITVHAGKRPHSFCRRYIPIT